MIRAIIFDLDNCLSAADEPGRELLDPVFDAIRQVNHGLLSDEALAEAFSDFWRHPLDFVAKKHGFTEEMLAAGWAVYVRLEVAAPMRGYADLCTLAELPVLLFLVTSGFRRLQERSGLSDSLRRSTWMRLMKPTEKANKAPLKGF